MDNDTTVMFFDPDQYFLRQVPGHYASDVSARRGFAAHYGIPAEWAELARLWSLPASKSASIGHNTEVRAWQARQPNCAGEFESVPPRLHRLSQHLPWLATRPARSESRRGEDSAAKWIAEQVQLSEIGALSPEKLQLLDERCGFDWRIGNTKDAKRSEGLQD